MLQLVSVPDDYSHRALHRKLHESQDPCSRCHDGAVGHRLDRGGLIQYIRNVLSDSTIREYGRDDLIDVFNTIEPFALLKACESFPHRKTDRGS